MTLQLAYQTVQQTLLIVSPEILLLAVAIAMMTTSPFVRLSRGTWAGLAAVGLVASLLVLLAFRGVHADLYAAPAVNDALAFYARLLLILTGLILVALGHQEPSDDRAGEFFGALLMIEAGAMLVTASNDIVFLFVGLELVSIPTYLLLYLSRRTATTQEAATKYFYLSVFASGLLLYGLAFLYGLAGTTNLKTLALLASEMPNFPNLTIGVVAVVFIMAGLCFRVAAVPLHFYAPDVYQGSPAVIAAMLSWIPKVIGFVAIIRVLTSVLSAKGAIDPLVSKAILLSWIIAAATMTLGNAVALLQRDLKRLLAYSSIAHAGYLMVGVTAAFANNAQGGRLYFGSEGIFFYLTAYALMTLGAFGVIIALKRPDGRSVQTIDELSGLGSQPLPALALAVCLLSLSGIPPLAGFWGKLQIFAAAFSAQSGDQAWAFYMLTIIGVLNAAVGAFYYLRIIVLMYLHPVGSEPLKVTGGWPVGLAIGACASLSLLIGLFPASVSEACRQAAVAAATHSVVADDAPVAHEGGPNAPVRLAHD
ncbi:NADH-quinone oxidoreductase subunit N [Paludisphaera borealis]|uniref:NADH-quinone oxidoreductase subunit N n=1 Tax=Paludisphaera borealis TaxID=1387353 RepID=A0A1U7CLG3_9BACT|nr:NADH-quinone oxidoreductase subunit N [Paludisphaera borealis]APW59748.1 NADH-quinone oxidoreductase subunit N [Paludisphaera borealis]